MSPARRISDCARGRRHRRLLLGALVAALLERWLRRLEPAHVRARRVRLSRELPWAADLLAAAVAGGASPEGALAAVAQATGPPLGEQLRAVSAAVQLGAHPRLAWSTADPALATLGRSMVRAGERGTPAADQLARLAEDLRAESRATSAAAVRAAAVQALAPLGACFLPALPPARGPADGLGDRLAAADLRAVHRPQPGPARRLRPQMPGQVWESRFPRPRLAPPSSVGGPPPAGRRPRRRSG